MSQTLQDIYGYWIPMLWISPPHFNVISYFPLAKFAVVTGSYLSSIVTSIRSTTLWRPDEISLLRVKLIAHYAILDRIV